MENQEETKNDENEYGVSIVTPEQDKINQAKFETKNITGNDVEFVDEEEKNLLDH